MGANEDHARSIADLIQKDITAARGAALITALLILGAGFAAAFAKIGAVLTAFFLPILLTTIGTQALLYGLIVTSLLGAAITWAFRIETTGVSLDTFDQKS